MEHEFVLKIGHFINYSIYFVIYLLNYFKNIKKSINFVVETKMTFLTPFAKVVTCFSSHI